jgi:hypothetical protein
VSGRRTEIRATTRKRKCASRQETLEDAGRAEAAAVGAAAAAVAESGVVPVAQAEAVDGEAQLAEDDEEGAEGSRKNRRVVMAA